MRAGFGYEFLERPDVSRLEPALRSAFCRPAQRHGSRLIYRASSTKKSTSSPAIHRGLIEALHLVPLVDDKHYFPPYDAVPIVRRDAIARFPNSSTRSPISPTKSQPKKCAISIPRSTPTSAIPPP